MKCWTVVSSWVRMWRITETFTFTQDSKSACHTHSWWAIKFLQLSPKSKPSVTTAKVTFKKQTPTCRMAQISSTFISPSWKVQKWVFLMVGNCLPSDYSGFSSFMSCGFTLFGMWLPRFTSAWRVMHGRVLWVSFMSLAGATLFMLPFHWLKFSHLATPNC